MDNVYKQMVDRLNLPSGSDDLLFTSDMSIEDMKAQFDKMVIWAKSTPVGCNVSVFSSRGCERGTKGCTVYHEDIPYE